MKTHTLYTFDFDELTPEAQQKAWEANYCNLSEDYSDEYRDTLKAFENAFDIAVYNWRVDDWTYSFDFVKAGTATECPEGDPLRVARYIWNNYAREITKGKFYSVGHYNNGNFSYKSKHSAILVEMDNCPLTGAFPDMDITRPVIACLHYKEFFRDFDDLITACLNEFFNSWRNAIEYANSFEYFSERASLYDWQFLEDGTLWRAA